MRRVILLEGVANLLVIAAKSIVGFSTGSMAILADAAHSLTDLANNIVAWLVVGAAYDPPDSKHPYGHKKFEIVAVFVLATLLSLVAIEIALAAFRRDADPIVSSTLGLILMLGTLAVNCVMATWQFVQARRLNSKLLAADARHTLSDALTTVGVIVAWQLSAAGYPILDTIFTLIVAGLVLYLAFQLFRQALPSLLDEVAVDSATAKQAVTHISGVDWVSRVRLRWMGEDIAIDVVVGVGAELSTAQSHDIADRIEEVLKDRFGASEVLVHVEPNTRSGGGE